MAYGCAAAFGPGYTVEKQRVAVTYTQQAPDHVSVQASYSVKNTGTKPLSELEIEPPYSEIIQPQELHVEWRGKLLEVPTPRLDSVDNSLHLPLERIWDVGERGVFVISYDVKISPDLAAVGSDHRAAFFLPSSGWLPILLPARGAFATGGAPPQKWDLVVNVPEGYRVRASGDNRGVDKKGKSKTEKRAGLLFEQRPGTNYDAFIAAGPYVEQQVRLSGSTVIFWTANPLSSKRSDELGKLVSSDAGFYSTEFGADETKKTPIWLIECPEGAMVLRERPWLSRTGCLTQPHSVVLPTEYLGATAPQDFTKSVDLQLAATWLYFSARPDRYGSLFPVAAIPDYAGVALAASRNPASRNESIRTLLQRVDSTPDEGKPLIRVDAKDSRELQDRARAESMLFFFALEDRCGAQNVHKGIARASRLLRGRTWGLADLRSAVESECGGPILEGFFREWMYGREIPAEFRGRYGAAGK
jgi:hypothetical protein